MSTTQQLPPAAPLEPEPAAESAQRRPAAGSSSEPGAPLAMQSPVYYYPAPRQSSGLTLLTVLLLGIFLLVLAMAATFFLFVASVTGWGGRTAGEMGQRVGAAVGSATDALGRASQEARDRFDPSHPPREALTYDPEIDDFLKLGLGQSLPGGKTRALTLSAIKSREDGGGRPELSRYVVVHSELRQPNETRVLGITVRTDAEPRDDYLYQGEAFRLGGQIYKVNWISPERQQIALIQLRDPDRASLPLKFVYE